MMEREQWAEHSGKEWAWVFDLSHRFTGEAYKLVQGTEIGQRDYRAAIRALLFGRIISGTEALSALSRSGFMTEADVIFRSNMEALFRLAALVEDENMFIPYLGEDYPRRRKAMGDIKQLLAAINPRPAGAVSEATLDEAISVIDRESQAFRTRHGVDRLREISTWEWVVAGKQHDFFHGKYLLHSNSAHHAARDLERRIVPRADGQGIEIISLGIDDESPISIILDSLLLLRRAIALFARSVTVEIPDALITAGSELDERFEWEARAALEPDGPG